MLKAEPDTILEAIERSLERTRLVERERDQLRQADLRTRAAALLSEADDDLLVAEIERIAADDLRQMAQEILERGGLRAVVLGSVLDEKVAVAVAAGDGLDAKELVKQLGPVVGGGGGGSPKLAVAGGKRPEALGEALDLARSILAGG